MGGSTGGTAAVSGHRTAGGARIVAPDGSTGDRGTVDATADAADLVRRARAHPLGEAFLREGALDAVCATFGVHAFVADAARDALG